MTGRADHDVAQPRATLRWSVEHVAALAPGPAQFAAADESSDLRRWSAAHRSGDVLWGVYASARAEPYETAVDLAPVFVHGAEPRTRCSCPSRKVPCKHAVALLLLWVRDQLADADQATVPGRLASWARRPARADTGAPDGTGGGDTPAETAIDDSPTAAVATVDAPTPIGDDTGDTVETADMPPAPPPPDRDGRDDRIERMTAGLRELDRWLLDRVRAGLSDPALAAYSTWDHLAARLVDARAGALANRVRRMAGVVGGSTGWHGELLAELGMLHLLARGGRALGSLPAPLADSLALALGWQVRQADVLAGVPESDVWDVIGRSDVREDRIEVRRTWLRGRAAGRLAMVLSFAAYRQSLDTSLPVGSAVDADVHRYPGEGVRALVGERRGAATAQKPPGDDLAGACDRIGALLAAEPWAEHLAVTVDAALTRRCGSWMLADDTGSMPCVAGRRAIGAVLASTGARPATVTVEWTPAGLVPLTVHLDDRAVDVGPRADPGFVEAA